MLLEIVVSVMLGGLSTCGSMPMVRFPDIGCIAKTGKCRHTQEHLSFSGIRATHD
jgi:hypothetical protein